MSDDKNLKDDLNEMLDGAKDEVKKAADRASKKAGEFAEEAKEAFKGAKENTGGFADEAKESAKEFANNASGENKKILIGILSIVLGWLGVHKFILGYNTEGVILLVLGLLGFFTCGLTSSISGIIGLIEGIIYLTKTDEEFYNTYQVGKKPWF